MLRDDEVSCGQWEGLESDDGDRSGGGGRGTKLGIQGALFVSSERAWHDWHGKASMKDKCTKLAVNLFIFAFRQTFILTLS